MQEIIPILSGMRRELEVLTKSVALINKTHAQRINEEWNRKPQVLKLLGISQRTLDKLTHSGKLPYTKINGLLYFRTSDVEKLLNDHYVRGTSTAVCSTPETRRHD